VHEVYFKLAGAENPQSWQGRSHFFNAAAEVMRRILVDKARRKRAVKHGGGRARVDLDADCSLASRFSSQEIDEHYEGLASLLEESLEAAAETEAEEAVDNQPAPHFKLATDVESLAPAQAAIDLLPAPKRNKRRRSFIRHFLYFGSSAVAALLADVLILRWLGVDLLKARGPLGFQSAIALFIEIVIVSSAAIAIWAYLRDGGALPLRARATRRRPAPAHSAPARSAHDRAGQGFERAGRSSSQI
jgi:hypothetical protein